MTLLFNLFLFFLPTQLAYHFWPNFSFIYGIRVDYLAVTIYLTDLIILANLSYAFIHQKKIFMSSYIYVLFIVLNILFSISPWVSLIRWLKILMLFSFGLYINKNRKILITQKALNIFFISLVLISVLGMAQFINNGSLNGLWYFLGERSFNLQTPGIALQNFFGSLKLRPYSTFSHPNSLAGYLVVGLIFLLIGKFKLNRYKIFGIIIILSCFILMGSLSAYLALFLSLLIISFKKFNYKLLILSGIVFSLILSKVSATTYLPKEIAERLSLLDFSLSVIKNNLFVGSGLNTFVVNSYRYLLLSKGNYILQPVHNIFILLLAEIGIIGVYIISRMNIKFENVKYVNLFILFVILTGLADHYWITLQQNLLIMTLVVFVVVKLPNEKRRNSNLHRWWLSWKPR